MRRWSNIWQCLPCCSYFCSPKLTFIRAKESSPNPSRVPPDEPTECRRLLGNLFRDCFLSVAVEARMNEFRCPHSHSEELSVFNLLWKRRTTQFLQMAHPESTAGHSNTILLAGKRAWRVSPSTLHPLLSWANNLEFEWISEWFTSMSACLNLKKWKAVSISRETLGTVLAQNIKISKLLQTYIFVKAACRNNF